MAAVRIREDVRSMTGAEKASIFILSLGEEYAARIFSHMNDDEIKELSQVMSNLGNVSSTLVEKLLIEFAEQITAGGGTVGSLESTERLLMKVLDKTRVGNIME